MTAGDWPTWMVVLLGAVVATVFVAGLLAINIVVADRRLAKWAAKSGYLIVWKQRRWLRCGPFTFGLSGGQIVYRLGVGTSDGMEQLGWAACSTGVYIWKDDFVDFRPDGSRGFPVTFGEPK